MRQPAGSRAGAAPKASATASHIVFTLLGERFAVPIEAVEAVAPPPPLARVPHAAPALLGAGHLGGRIVPILDLARLLGLAKAAGDYDGTGEILRLGVEGGSVGLWVDKVERVIGALDDPGDMEIIDAASLLAGGLDAPPLAVVAQAPLGEVARRAVEAPVRAPAPAFIVVEVGTRHVKLPRDSVEELVESVPWTPIPRSPDGLLGVGLLRGTALPVLSLAVLLGLGADWAPGGFAAIEVGGRRALLAVDRIIGLRFQSSEADGGGPVDVAAAIPDELRRIVLGFAPGGDEGPAAEAAATNETSAYVAFTVAGLDCAVAVECVDRIIGPQRLIRLPRPIAGRGDGAVQRLDGAIELRGQVLPVAPLRSRLGLVAEPDPPPEPQAYVILRGAGGLGAIGIDRAKQLVRLWPADIVPTPADEATAIAGVAAWGDGGLLRIIAADRLWSGA